MRAKPSFLAFAAILLAAAVSRAATYTVNVGSGGMRFVDPISNSSTTTITAGDTVHWVWAGSGHSSTSGTPCTHNTTGSDVWDSATHNVPFTFDHTFNTIGTFHYFCTPHCGFGMTATVNVVGPADHLSVGMAASAVTGSPVNITVVMRDTANSVAVGYTGTVHFTSTDSSATLPADYTFTVGVGGDNGQHVFVGGVTFQTPGVQTVTATDTVTSSITGVGLPVTVSFPPGLHVHYFTVVPCRLVDTRKASGIYGGPALAGGGAQRQFVIAGQCGVDSGAVAVSGNVTVIGPAGAGDLRMFPTGTAVPTASIINFSASITRANNIVLSLLSSPSAGSATVQSDLTGTTNMTLDITGYFK